MKFKDFIKQLQDGETAIIVGKEHSVDVTIKDEDKYCLVVVGRQSANDSPEEVIEKIITDTIESFRNGEVR